MSVKIDSGLIFSIPLSENAFGFGQLVVRQEPIFYMVGYDARSESPHFAEEDVRRSKAILVGNFFDILIRNGRWTPLQELPIPKVPFPCFKIKIGDKFYVESWDRQRKREATPNEIAVLQPRTNYGPIFLENALRAYFGLHPWEPAFDPLKIENVVNVSKMC
jgi:hypothetical protein